MRLLTVLAVLGATSVALGRYQGYDAVSACLAFWLLTTLTFLIGWNVVSRLFTPAPILETFVRIAVVSFAVVVTCGLGLGLTGYLTTGAYLVAETALVVATLFIPRLGDARPPCDHTGGAPASAPPDAHAIPAWVVGITGALLAFVVAFAMTHAPLTLYDSISYHLFFAARWLQDRALSIVPTPFSDEAQAYAPANGELFFLWLMLPFHGDLFARFGQLPFTLLTAAALYLTARRLGAPPEHAVYPPAFFALSRPVLEGSAGANVDLVCAAMFMTSLYLGVVALDSGRRRDWMVWGACAGLYFGSKYVALVYAPIVLLFLLFSLFLRVPRVPGLPTVPLESHERPSPLAALWALPGIAACGLPWYIRNWIVAGSPIYPASLKLAGVTIARGAFGREAMLNTVFHTNDLRLLPIIAARGFGPTLFVIWLPVAVIGGIALVRGGWWPHRFVLAVPLLMVPLYWYAFPVNIDPRFLMPALAPALLPFAFTFRRDRRWNFAVHVAYLAAAMWIVVGIHRIIPVSAPWFMTDWLALDGLVKPGFVWWFTALAALIAAVWHTVRRTRWAVPLLTVLVASMTVTLTAAATSGQMAGEPCLPARCEYLDTTSPHIRPDLLAAWQWFAARTRNATVAYTGINLPYPLSGNQLANRVVYVNIDGRPGWRFHDYDRAFRAGRFDPIPPALAKSSGELMPVAERRGPRDDAVRPRYERMQGLRDAWIDNLRRLKVDYLFVSALSAYEIDYVWHNRAGFPVEDEWADSDPAAFGLVYENGQVRIYRVTLPEAQ